MSAIRNLSRHAEVPLAGEMAVTCGSALQEPKVVLFVGAGRSGSTVLEMLLASQFDVVGVGELRWLWDRGYRDNVLCSCGAPTRQCGFWRDVFERIEATYQTGQALDAAIDNYLAVVKRRRIGLYPDKVLRRRQAVAEARSLVAATYQAIHSAAGGRAIIDSSKDPSFAAVATGVPGLRRVLVSLIRDSRGVVYSWQRRRVRPEIHWNSVEMDRPGVVKASLDWVYCYLSVIRLGIGRDDYGCIGRYEVFALNPDGLVERLQAECVAAGIELGESSGASIYHSVSGNPVRFSESSLRVAPDHEWRSMLRRRDRWVCTALTGPFLAAHLISTTWESSRLKAARMGVR